MSASGEGHAAKEQPQQRQVAEQIETLEKLLEEYEAELSAKQDELKQAHREQEAELSAKQDALKRDHEEYEAELSAKQAELKQAHNAQEAELSAKQAELKEQMDSKIDGIRQRMIEVQLSTEPEPEPLGYHPPTTAFDGLVDLKEFEKFAEHPYFVYPGKKNSVYVMVPKFYPSFQVGWLLDEVDGVWNRYEVNQYAVLFGAVPEQIGKHLKMPTPIPATVKGNIITFDPADKKEVRRRLPAHVTDWTENSARITRDNEFKVIDWILQSGHVPFEPSPVRDEHMVSGLDSIKLRDYQQPAWDNFLATGAVGIFHPTGSGKSFLGMAALSRIRVGKRRNLVISPKRTLVDQWREYMSEHVPGALENTLITTYQGFKNYDEHFGVIIYDECRSLPATTFVRLSTITTEYRMGLDATPYREDGRNHLIVTLTGHPQRLNWQEYMRKYGPGYHAVYVHVVQSQHAKLLKAKKLYDPRRRTMFYSYHLGIGEKLADKLGLPFISASTDDRLGVMRDNHSFVASSVFGEGLHVEDLDSIIEIDFHYGSRREEMQLSGRLMHSRQQRKAHHIIMTYEEFDKYKKRLLSLEGNGFHVRLMED